MQEKLKINKIFRQNRDLILKEQQQLDNCTIQQFKDWLTKNGFKLQGQYSFTIMVKTKFPSRQQIKNYKFNNQYNTT